MEPALMRKLETIITEQRAQREDLQHLKQEFRLLREELQVVHSALNRLDDTLRYNVVDRLQALEAKQ